MIIPIIQMIKMLFMIMVMVIIALFASPHLEVVSVLVEIACKVVNDSIQVLGSRQCLWGRVGLATQLLQAEHVLQVRDEACSVAGAVKAAGPNQPYKPHGIACKTVVLVL